MSEALIGRALLSLDLARGNLAGKMQAQMREVEAAGRGSGSRVGNAIGGGFNLATVGIMAAAGAALAGVGAVTAFSTNAVSRAEAAGQAAFEMSEKFGLFPGQASAWLAAADAVGVSNESISNGFKFVSRDMEQINLAMQAGQKPPKALTEAFEQLGVNIFDSHGKLRDLNSILFDVSKAFAAMPDGPEKAGLAVKLFSRSGTDLLPLLNQGVGGINKFMDAAKKSGAVMSDSQVKAAHEAYLAHKQFDQAVSGLSMQLGARLLPALTVAAEAGVKVMNAALDKMPGILRAVQPILANVQKFFSDMAPTLRQVADAAGKMLAPMLSYLGKHMDLIAKVFEAVGIVALVVIGGFAAIGIASVGVVAGVVWLYEKFKETLPRALGAIQNFVIGTVKFFRELWSNVTGVWKQITDAVGHAAQELHDRPIYWITRLLLLGPQLQIQLAQKVRATWDKMSGEALTFGSQFLRNVIQFLQQLPGNVWRWLVETLQRLGEWELNMVRRAGEIAGGFVDALRNTITRTDWGALGRGVLGGIVEGIQSALRAVGGVAAGIAAQILRAFKDALGISSPSRVMAAQVGGPIVDGIVAGVSAGNLARRLGDQARSIRSSFDALTAPGSGGAGGAGGGTRLDPNAENAKIELMVKNNRLMERVVELLSERDPETGRRVAQRRAALGLGY